jgi:hypothetical protein
MNHLISTIKFRDQPLVNCIATSLLAFVLTIPMHELFHPLPQQPYHLLLVLGILLVLIDLIILGPGLVINSK